MRILTEDKLYLWILLIFILFKPIILETLILRYELKGKARTRSEIFRVVLGPCAQFYPREASEQK